MANLTERVGMMKFTAPPDSTNYVVSSSMLIQVGVYTRIPSQASHLKGVLPPLPFQVKRSAFGPAEA